jgi:hypothetical protein
VCLCVRVRSCTSPTKQTTPCWDTYATKQQSYPARLRRRCLPTVALVDVRQTNKTEYSYRAFFLCSLCTDLHSGPPTPSPPFPLPPLHTWIHLRANCAASTAGDRRERQVNIAQQAKREQPSPGFLIRGDTGETRRTNRQTKKDVGAVNCEPLAQRAVVPPATAAAAAHATDATPASASVQQHAGSPTHVTTVESCLWRRDTDDDTRRAQQQRHQPRQLRHQ